MSANSRKHRAEKKRQKLEKRRELIPGSLASMPATQVPSSVALGATIDEIDEAGARKFQVTFRNLDLAVCDISRLDDSVVR